MKNKMRTSLNQLTTNDDSVPKRPRIHKTHLNQAIGDTKGSFMTWSPVMDRAQEIQASLSPNFPSFTKPVHRSNVSSRFCLYLPKEFCDEHLPRHDGSIVLVDEKGEEHLVKYMLLRNKLDGGWRGFANAQKLMEGDALVFQLIDHCKFKVHVARVPETNGARGLLKSDAHVKPIYNGQVGSGDEFGRKVPEVIKSSKPIVKFKDMKCFEDFEVRVDGFILDSEIPSRLRKKYYDLCCSQERLLHDHLIESLNIKLAIGTICETTNIASAVRAADLSVTSLQDLKWWDNTLEALEVLGMSVEFLRDRLHKLITLASKSKSIVESNRKRRAELKNDLISFDLTLVEAKVLMDVVESEIEDLEMKNEKIRFEFTELAGAPWCT